MTIEVSNPNEAQCQITQIHYSPQPHRPYSGCLSQLALHKLKITPDAASSASLIHSPKPIKPAHATMLRFAQRLPCTVHGNHRKHPEANKKALNFIPSSRSLSQKDTGWTRASRMNSPLKRSEGGLFELRLVVKAKERIYP